MSVYIIGDVQGQYQAFVQLLEQINFMENKDLLIFVGDVVNRGLNSLAMLQWLYTHQACSKMVLGNHDLHLLAVAAGVAKKQHSDTLDEILTHPKCADYLLWLRHQPLFLEFDHSIVVHAGILPEWTVAQAKQYAQEVEFVLQSSNFVSFLAQMYGHDDQPWSDSLQNVSRLRFIINVLTRMRMLHLDGRLEYRYKGTLADAPPHLIPWFKLPPLHARQHTILCGHWSALGLYQGNGIVALDTGSIWGGALTAIRLEDGEIFQA